MAKFIAVTHERGQRETIHRQPSIEECNVDDARHHTLVDEETARQLVEKGLATACGHCDPFPDVMPGVG